MPIILNKPIIEIRNDVGNTFYVISCELNFFKKEASFFWRIKTGDGKVLRQGIVILKDHIVDNKPANDFTKWYNEEYKSHEDLVKKIVILAGHSGEFHVEELV